MSGWLSELLGRACVCDIPQKLSRSGDERDDHDQDHEYVRRPRDPDGMGEHMGASHREGSRKRHDVVSRTGGFWSLIVGDCFFMTVFACSLSLIPGRLGRRPSIANSAFDPDSASGSSVSLFVVALFVAPRSVGLARSLARFQGHPKHDRSCGRTASAHMRLSFFRGAWFFYSAAFRVVFHASTRGRFISIDQCGGYVFLFSSHIVSASHHLTSPYD